MNSQGKIRIPGSKSLSAVLCCKDSDFVDFIRRCLIWKPEERMTPDEALKHPWILNDWVKDAEIANSVSKKIFSQYASSRGDLKKTEARRKAAVKGKEHSKNEELKSAWKSKPRIGASNGVVNASLANVESSFGELLKGEKQNTGKSGKLGSFGEKKPVLTKGNNSKSLLTMRNNVKEKYATVGGESKPSAGKTKGMIIQTNNNNTARSKVGIVVKKEGVVKIQPALHKQYHSNNPKEESAAPIAKSSSILIKLLKREAERKGAAGGS